MAIEKARDRVAPIPGSSDYGKFMTFSANPFSPSMTFSFDVEAICSSTSSLVRILDRELKLAGIAKKDERGRSVDVHALRHAYGTLLSKAGVTPRTAQAAMRHSSIDLTMIVYHRSEAAGRVRSDGVASLTPAIGRIAK